MKIADSVLNGIIEHAIKDKPIEACGYLAGKAGVIKKHFALTNIDKSPEHFSFDPKEQFKAAREAANQGLELLGVYHSHPASPARPSEEDIALAYDASFIYIIVSLLNETPAVKGFKITNKTVTEEKLEGLVNERI